MPKVATVRLLTVIMFIFFTLSLAGCGNSWNPFSPISDFWEKSEILVFRQSAQDNGS